MSLQSLASELKFALDTNSPNHPAAAQRLANGIMAALVTSEDIGPFLQSPIFKELGTYDDSESGTLEVDLFLNFRAKSTNSACNYKFFHKLSVLAAGQTDPTTRFESELVSLILRTEIRLTTQLEHLLPKYPEFHLKHGSKHFAMAKYVVDTPDSNAIDASLRFILELLNHGSSSSLDFFEFNTLTSSLLLALQTVGKLKDDKIKLYTHFNHTRATVSLSVLLSYLNFLISFNLLRSIDSNIVLPEAILNQFRHFNLPPMPLPNEFLIEGLFSQDQVSNHLLFAMVENLNLLATIFEDELNSFNYLKTPLLDTANTNIALTVLENLFASTITTLVFTERYTGSNFAKSVIRHRVYDILELVVRPEFCSYVDHSVIWITLFNYSNDVCYTDLRYIPVFKQLFDHLAKDSTYSIVQSGVEFFTTTFTPTRMSTGYVEVHVDDFKLVYQPNRENQTKREFRTATKPAYVSN